MRRAACLLGIAFAAALPATALAGWGVGGSGGGYSKAAAMAAGSSPTACASLRSVTVSWSASGGSVPVSGYAIKRYDANGNAQTVGSGCSGTITGLSCTEQAVPGGQWRYTVTPLNNNWRGSESAQSAAVTVAAPSLSLTPTSVSSLPAALSGQIQNFVSGQTVTFRLDNATTGTVLSGSISPSPVPASGTSSVSVTLPAGTANGAHTIYAIGSAGDIASAAVTVSGPVTTTFSVSAWDGRDASAGGSAVNQSDTSAYAGDSRTAASGAFATTFSTSRFLQYTFDNPLPTAGVVSSAAFNFNFAGTAAGTTSCFYFEVRKASTGTVLGTHGSAASPVACATGTTLKTTSTSLPEVAKGETANDLQVRVYASSSASQPLNVDLATVSGSSSGMAFTLYETSFVDSSTGNAAAAAPWMLFAADGVFHTTVGDWATTYSSSRYLKLTFPSYVPTGATIKAVSIKHSYRSATSGANVCYYAEVYSDANLIGAQGSSKSPISCNSSSTASVTDTITLPSSLSVAALNSLSVNLYVSRSTVGKSRHDLAELTITYVK